VSVTPSAIDSAPFDSVADRYDETFTTSKIGTAQRASVWNHLEKTFCRGDRVVEIGCGTGVDACFLADRGVSVVACDSSPRMISVAMHRVSARNLEGLVSPHVVSAEDIATLSTEDFAGAFSNFGALNCVEDLRGFASNLASLLPTGATALVCLLGSSCLWEITWYLLHGNPRKAFRRLRRGGITARLSDGVFVRVYYPTVSSLERTFAPWFSLRSIRGIGISVPPSYLEQLAYRYPRLFALQKRADPILGKVPGLRGLADHILLKFERTHTPSEHPAAKQ
jgi:SAM-dependent methyltransferase